MGRGAGRPRQNVGTTLRYTGELDDLHIPPLQSFRAIFGGSFLAQIPVAGESCDVPEWSPASAAAARRTGPACVTA